MRHAFRIPQSEFRIRADAVERYVYDPYGDVTVYSDDWSTTVDWDDSKKNAIRYCGYYFDNETGLYCVRYRYYVPPLGRWLQRDPAGYGDGMGLYAYVDSAPIVHLDGTGLTYYNTSGGWGSGAKRRRQARRGRSESIFDAISREARSRGKNFCAGFDVTFMVIPVCPGVTIEGSAGLQGCVLECCHLDGPHVGKTGLMIDGTVWVKVSGGIGTSVGKQIYRGGASAHITKSMPPCENTLSLAIDVGVGGHASVGWGPASAGPEFDVHYTIGLYDDPGGFDWSGGIGTGRGTGVRLEVYGKGHGDGRLVV